MTHTVVSVMYCTSNPLPVYKAVGRHQRSNDNVKLVSVVLECFQRQKQAFKTKLAPLTKSVKTTMEVDCAVQCNTRRSTQADKATSKIIAEGNQPACLVKKNTR